jgi:hypothetical protein
LEELHVTLLVKSRTLLSEKAPLTVSCRPDPTIKVGFAGVIVKETSPATFSEAELLTLPAVAVNVVAPVASAFTAPALPGALLTVATAGLEEFQMTDLSICVLPSLKVPVATIGWVCPGIRYELVGDTVMEIRLGGVRLAG